MLSIMSCSLKTGTKIMRILCDDKIITKGALVYEEIAVYRRTNCFRTEASRIDLFNRGRLLDK